MRTPALAVALATGLWSPALLVMGDGVDLQTWRLWSEGGHEAGSRTSRVIVYHVEWDVEDDAGK